MSRSGSAYCAIEKYEHTSRQVCANLGQARCEDDDLELFGDNFHEVVHAWPFAHVPTRNALIRALPYAEEDLHFVNDVLELY